ncbi:glycosyltransferase 87 family protein [Falsihalocynthiibacter sp. SS001]|uniref:glycosyltransferase 87 family protein n=1 Tax=Falsihalocynthiibacter sp. SS001 TaxID=3349698 RepID=UPI0036D39F5C
MPNSQSAPLRDHLLVLLFISLAVVLSIFMIGDTSSPDLKALWTAGEFYASGQYKQIYPTDTTHFTMTAPSEWVSHLFEREHEGQIFPYIYPPIWAALAAKVTTLISYSQLLSITNVLNPALIGLTIYMAWRAGDKHISAPIFTLVGLVVILGTTCGMIALFQNQPQILVSFLIVCAIERSVNGGSRMAGAALGIAAAIKLYPVIFAIFLFARGDRNSLIAFIGVGGGLGLLSIALAGWPMHAQFLQQIAAISSGALLTPISYSIDATIANLMFQDSLKLIPATLFETNEAGALRVNISSDAGWKVIPKSEVWVLLDRVLFFGTILAMSILMRRRSRDIAVWPFAITLLALVSPLTWVYHYLPALAFAPMLLERLNVKVATYILLIYVASNTLGVLPYYRMIPTDFNILQLMGTFSMALYATVWGYVLLRHPRNAP